MKYLQNIDDIRATVRAGDVNISLPPSTSHNTEQVYNNTVSHDDDNNGEATYGNVQHDEVTTKYRIPVTELQNVIRDKHTNDGFLKEYEVSVLCYQVNTSDGYLCCLVENL
jgi:hypothetical protein